jgi:hypothetical protein
MAQSNKWVVTTRYLVMEGPKAILSRSSILDAIDDCAERHLCYIRRETTIKVDETLTVISVCDINLPILPVHDIYNIPNGMDYDALKKRMQEVFYGK